MPHGTAPLPPLPEDRVAYGQAQEALNVALGQEFTRATERVGELYEDCGWSGMQLALTVWCEFLSRYMPETEGSDHPTIWMNAESGKVSTDADDVPPEVRWAGWLALAYKADDEANFDALLASVPQNDVACVEHASALLCLVGATVFHKALSTGEWPSSP